MITNQIDTAIRSAKAISEQESRQIFVWSDAPCSYELDVAIPKSHHSDFICYVIGDEVFWKLPN